MTGPLPEALPFWFWAIHEADIVLAPGAGGEPSCLCIPVPVDSRLSKTNVWRVAGFPTAGMKTEYTSGCRGSVGALGSVEVSILVTPSAPTGLPILTASGLIVNVPDVA